MTNTKSQNQKTHNFRIPQPFDLNICDQCFKTRTKVYGSTFLGVHYTLCSNFCKEAFIKEGIAFEKLIKGETDLVEDHHICNRCEGSFPKRRTPVIYNELVFCSEICKQVYSGEKDPFYWMKRKSNNG